MANEPKTNKKKKQSVTHAQFAQLLLKLAPLKEGIVAALAAGLPVTDLAKDHQVADSTMKSILDALGIPYGRQPKRDPAKLWNDLLTVVARLAAQLEVNYDEIKPYLPSTPTGK